MAQRNSILNRPVTFGVLGFIAIAASAFFWLYQSPTVTLLAWSPSSDLSIVKPSFADFELTQHNGRNCLRIMTRADQQFPGVRITPSAEFWDGRSYQFVVIDVTNKGEHPCEVGVRIDGIAPTASLNLSDRVCLVMPGQTRTARANLFVTPWKYPEPQTVEAMRAAPGQSLFPRFGMIKSISVYVRQSIHDHQLLIDDLRLETPVRTRKAKRLLPIVDRYGQLNATDWMGKVESDQQLFKRAGAEKISLALVQPPAQWSNYGGWSTGPKQTATGSFRTEKVNGRWWLVDPDGHLFWSHGVDSVSTAYSATGTQDREAYFEWLPPNKVEALASAGQASNPLGEFYYQASWAHAPFYQSRVPYWSYNFLIANLYRQYGPDWSYEFIDCAHQRLLAWRMNTMAAWSDPQITSQQRTPYTAFVRIADCPYIEGSHANWQPFVDVFAPEFEIAVDETLQTRVEAFDDPWCIGFFVDNELSWGEPHSLADGVIRSPATQPAKVQWVKFLKQKYPNIDSLNESWESGYESWDEVLTSRAIHNASEQKDSSLVDRTAFSRQITEKYFSTIARKLKELAPDRLYLGCRFFWKNNQALEIAARYCDVVSINNYHFLADHVSLPEGVDKPIVIGEFHFGATDRGMLHPTNVPADNQADRAAKYKGYVESALRNPAIVGTHWFQYVDNPVTGRGDENNANVGLITITHQPYPELVQAITEVGEQMYEIRSSAGKGATNRESANVR